MTREAEDLAPALCFWKHAAAGPLMEAYRKAPHADPKAGAVLLRRPRLSVSRQTGSLLVLSKVLDTSRREAKSAGGGHRCTLSM